MKNKYAEYRVTYYFVLFPVISETIFSTYNV